MKTARAKASKSWRTLALLCCLGAAATACDAPETAEPAQPLARPVSYVTLKRSDPSLRSLVAGSVESWKKELVGFEVDGRVKLVRESGVNIEGRRFDQSGNLLAPGTLIGKIENDRYRLRVKEAEARVESVVAEAEMVRTEIEKTIPQELREIQAEYERAKKEYDRQKYLLNTSAGTKKRVETARADFKVNEAKLAQLRARRQAKKAQLASIQAQIVEAKEALRQAELDLADTELYAPFNGQISEVHVIPGGYVERGQPVVTMQMMDPMKIQVAVSPEVDRQVKFNDLMKVYIDGIDEPLKGWVWNKDTVADASTRTFMITLLVRNRQVDADLPAELAGKGHHRAEGLWNLETEHDDGHGPYFTNEETLHRDEEGYYVWKAEGLSVDSLEQAFNPVFRVRKLPVTPGERRIQFLEAFNYRKLEDIGGLDPKNDLLAGKLPAGVKDGDTIMLSRKRWMLRPGQLVRVDLHHGRMPAGFYVPAQSIIKSGTGHQVFVVEQQANGEEQVSALEVEPGASFGTLQAIKPVGDAALTPGMKLIVDGAHYLRGGDLVNAYQEVETVL